MGVAATVTTIAGHPGNREGCPKSHDILVYTDLSGTAMPEPMRQRIARHIVNCPVCQAEESNFKEMYKEWDD